MVRMDDSRLPKAVMYAELREGTRTVGGQNLRYKDVLKRNLKAAGAHVNDWDGRSLPGIEVNTAKCAEKR